MRERESLDWVILYKKAKIYIFILTLVINTFCIKSNASFTSMNSDFENNGNNIAFTSSDAYQENTISKGSFYYTEYRYQAGSRRTGSKRRVFSNSGTHDTNSVGDTTDVSLGNWATDTNLNKIPQQKALSGYFPEGATLTFKLKTCSCGHDVQNYVGIKVGEVPTEANNHFDKYGYKTYRSKITKADGTERYGYSGIKVGTDSWTRAEYDWKFTEDKDGVIKDDQGDNAADWIDWYTYQFVNLDYPSEAWYDASSSCFWIFSGGGGKGGCYDCGSTTLVVTYKCTKTGEYTFYTMGYSEHCSGGPNHVSFNTESQAIDVNMSSVDWRTNGGYIDEASYNGSLITTILKGTSTMWQGDSTQFTRVPSWAYNGRTHRSGYAFTGWYTAPDGGTQVFDSNGNYQVGSYWDSNGNWCYSGDVILYAQWERTPTYAVNVDYDDGGSGINYTVTTTQGGTVNKSSGSSYSITLKYGDSYSVTNISTPDRYNLSTSNTSGTIGSNDVTTTLTYRLKTYTVSYDANGGSGAPSSQTKRYGYGLTLSSSIPSWEGHKFVKWTEERNGGGDSYNKSGTYTKNESKTLYAQWELIPYTYRVKIDADDGLDGISYKVETTNGITNKTASEHSETIYCNNTYKVSDISVPDRYELTTSNTSGTVGASDVTTTLTYRIKRYSIRYDTNGGTPSNWIEENIKKYGYDYRISDIRPEKDWSLFIGWIDNNNRKWAGESGNWIYRDNLNLELVAEYLQGEVVEFNPNDRGYINGVQQTIKRAAIQGRYNFYNRNDVDELVWARQGSKVSGTYKRGYTLLSWNNVQYGGEKVIGISLEHLGNTYFDDNRKWRQR